MCLVFFHYFLAAPPVPWFKDHAYLNHVFIQSAKWCSVFKTLVFDDIKDDDCRQQLDEANQKLVNILFFGDSEDKIDFVTPPSIMPLLKCTNYKQHRLCCWLTWRRGGWLAGWLEERRRLAGWQAGWQAGGDCLAGLAGWRRGGWQAGLWFGHYK